MRICEVVLAPAIGGAEVLALGLADHWRRDGHEVEFLALEHPQRGEGWFPEPVAVASELTSAPGRRLRRVVGTRRVLKRGGYDVVHAHSFLPNLYARLALVAGNARPVSVVTLHSGADDYWARRFRFAERALLGRTDAVVAVTPALVDEYGAHFGAARSRIRLIPNGVDVAETPKRPLEAAPSKFVAIGRLAPAKDIETLLRGFDLFAREHEQVSLRIVGPDSDAAYAAAMRRVQDSLPTKDRMTFVGRVERVQDELEQADVFVHAAVMEAHPIGLLEAAAYGVPIVCSAIPSVKRIFGESVSYFETQSPEDMARALAAVRADWSGLGARALQARSAVPSLADTARAYLDLFGELTARRAA